MDPRVSVPIANAHKPAAVADADPALEPLLPSFMFQGFFVRPPYQISLYANAPRVVFPNMTAPAALSFFTIVASLAGILLLYGSAPQPVLIPLVSKRSLRPYGIPWRGPKLIPTRVNASMASASAKA